MRVVVGIDGSAASLDALEAVARSYRDGDDVTVVAVVPPPDDVSLLDAHPFDRPASPRADAARAGEILRGRRVPATALVLDGRPGETLCSVADEWRADLLVVGASAGHGAPRRVLGSVAQYVAGHAACDVLIARRRTRGRAGDDTWEARDVTTSAGGLREA